MNSNIQSENKFYRIYLIGFFLILLLPILNIQPWFSPAAWGKTVVLKIIISVLIFLFIYQLLYQKIKIKPVNLCFWLFLSLGGIFLLATIFSSEKSFSLWGSPYRGGGSLNFLLCLFFAVLVFLILKPKDWEKIWDFAFIGGFFVSVLAVLQKFELFGDILVPYTGRTVSSLGSPNLLGLYLVLLLPLALSFGLKTKGKKRIFYFLCFILFLTALLLSATRAAVLGIFVALVFFVFFYPLLKQKKKLAITIKVSFGIFLILGILGLYYISNHPQISQKLEENKILGTVFQRISPLLKDFSIYKLAPESRISAWKISLLALKDKPILGYGPDNFSIVFDKYYDPNLAGFENTWWDKAHNFVFDIALTAGIPALIIYLSLFGILFWQLWKIKNNEPIVNGIRATFIGYLATNFFIFDTIDTYLISFLLIGYSLSLIRESQINKEGAKPPPLSGGGLAPSEPLWKSALIFILFCAMLWFVWIAALKPLKINKEINWAVYFAENKKCQEAINKMEGILSSDSIINNYLELQYINIIGKCMDLHPEQKIDFSKKAIEVLDKAKLSRPLYTRTWLFLGTYINIFVESSPNLELENKKDLLGKALAYLQKAHELSPKRQEIFNVWIKTDLLAANYQQAKEKAQKCIDIYPEYANCWWGKALANLYLNEIEEAKKNMDIAIEKGYEFRLKKSYSQLLNAYLKMEQGVRDTDYYKNLAEIYENLIRYEPDNFQYHASLAYVYKELKEYEKAGKEAVTVFVLSPESKPKVEQFLNSLPTDVGFYRTMANFYKRLIDTNPNDYQHHASLAFVYKQLGEYDKARKEAMIVLELRPDFEPFVKEFLNTLP